MLINVPRGTLVY